MTARRKELSSILVKPAGPDCNMACTYCFYLEKDALFPDEKHRMGDDVLEEMIRQAMTRAGPHITFGWQGGEPTLMGLPFFEKAVALQKRYGRGQSVGNGLQTNGLLIDASWLPLLNDYSFLVGLSLDGPEHVHDKYRRNRGGAGTWQKVVGSARLMLDAGVAVNALTTINDHTVRFPGEIYAFHKDLGLTYMQFIPLIQNGPGCAPGSAPFTAPAEDYGRFLCTVFDLWRGDFEDGVPTTSVRFFDSLFYKYVDLDPPECSLLPECGVYVVVEHNGDVFACDFYVEPEWKLGNVMEKNLDEMLNSSRQRAFGRMKADLPAVCLECPWKELCCGGCACDRVRDAGGRDENHYCRSFRMFFEHADASFRDLARKWQEQQALEQEVELEAEREALRRAQDGGGGGVGRNDPCPCGSGKKYKKCCGRRA